MPSEALRTLWKQFSGASIQNSESKWFLPDSKLVQTIQEFDPLLEECLREANIEQLEQKEILSVIRNGGQKVFAILVLMQGHPVELMLNFMRGDQMLQNNLDARLPFGVDELKLVIKDDILAGEFFRRQWELLSPLFRSDRTHRELKHQTILPFIQEMQIPHGEGGCGIVTKVTLHAAHHHFKQDFNVISEVSFPILFHNYRVSDACRSRWLENKSK